MYREIPTGRDNKLPSQTKSVKLPVKFPVCSISYAGYIRLARPATYARIPSIMRGFFKIYAWNSVSGDFFLSYIVFSCSIRFVYFFFGKKKKPLTILAVIEMNN